MGKIAIIARFPLSFLFFWAFSWSMASAEINFQPGQTGYQNAYEKTANFTVEKHSMGDGRAFLSIPPGAITDGTTTNPGRIFLYGFQEVSYTTDLRPESPYGEDRNEFWVTGQTNDYIDEYRALWNAFPGERVVRVTANGTFYGGIRVDDDLTVGNEKTVSIANGKLYIQGLGYFCLFQKIGAFSTTQNLTAEPQRAVLPGDAVSSLGFWTAGGYPNATATISGAPFYSVSTGLSTVPDLPWTFSVYGWYAHPTAHASDYDCANDADANGALGLNPSWTNYENKPYLVSVGEYVAPPAREDQPYEQCLNVRHNVEWSKTVDDWGTLIHHTTDSGTYGGGYWDGFMRIFSDSDAYKVTNYARIQHGTDGRFDRINFENAEELNLGDPYEGDALTRVKGGTIDVYSYSGGVQQVINGIEIVTQGLYADGVYANVEFLNAKGEVAYYAPLIPQTLTGGTRLVAYVPVYKTLAPVRARLKGIKNIAFLGIVPMRSTRTVEKSSCRSNAVFCGWRSTNAREPLGCVNFRNFETDPFNPETSTGGLSFCEIRSNACRPIVSTGTFLGAEGVKASLLIGGNGSYYVDASGSLKFDASKESIGGITGTDSAWKCDTSGLSWYQYAPKYFDCAWAFILNTSDEGINKPMQVGTQISDKASQAGSGSTSIRNWVDSTPDTVETNAVLAPFRDSKSLSDAGYGWGRLVVWVVAFVMLMVLIGLFFAFTSRPGKN